MRPLRGNGSVNTASHAQAAAVCTGSVGAGRKGSEGPRAAPPPGRGPEQAGAAGTAWPAARRGVSLVPFLKHLLPSRWVCFLLEMETLGSPCGADCPSTSVQKGVWNVCL